jgi:hypothetical protein
MLSGSCHCGAIRWSYEGTPEKLTDCNCSMCRRVAGLWAYGTEETITVTGGPLIRYLQGDRSLAFCSCATCGCTTHWEPVEGEPGGRRMAVNVRMADPAEWAGIRIRRFDGADTWAFLD